MSIYDTLNKEQKKAVEQTEGPVLILAGAGSGKTRVLTHRVAYLIDEMGVNPWNILAITFTNKAAQEMRERVDNIVGFGAEQIWVATFHATCVKILRRYIDRLGYDTHFTIYDTDDQKRLIKDACKKLQIDTKKVKERTILGEISSAKNEMISAEEYRLNATYDFGKQTIAKVYEEYQKNLKKNNALDFDDLLLKTVELFKTQEDVLNQYRERFRYIMVDEYQDTNTVQFELIRLLADKYRNLCVVGDDDQSIYKFRGANIRNILDFEKVYPDALVVKLEQNYRSTGNILEAANGVVRHNRGRKEKALWTESDKGEKLRFKQFNTGYDEAEFVADDMMSIKRKENLNFNDFAVLYRTNQQSRLIEERLVVEGIPYRLVGGVNFYARVEIKDILAYLKTVANGLDDLAVKRIINIPKRGIGATTITKIDNYAERLGISFYEALTQCENIPGLGKTVDKINGFVNLIRVLRAKEEYSGIVDMIQEVMDAIDYDAYLEENYEDDFEDRKENVGELINKATVYEQTHDEISLEDFLEEVALVADVDSLDQNNDTVVLMTIHGSKGLEFNRVYMVGMEDGLFPSYMSISSEDEGDIEEERRLAYVGITRARQTLVLTCARSRMMNGTTQYNPISRFANEIPKHLFDNPPGKPAFSNFGGREYLDNPFEGSLDDSKVFPERTSYDFRPKAVLKPKVTATPNKPYILKNIENMQGVSKGMADVAAQGLEYKEGDRVKHIKFGEGTVVAIVQEKRDYKVTVDFDLAGQKIMYASFAKLKLV